MKKRILVFPCGSEIGLEIYRAVRYSAHFELIGGSSVKDHGEFVYKNIIKGLPFYNDENFEQEITRVVDEYGIDAIYPAMDSVAEKLTSIASRLKCKIITSPQSTTNICLSKSRTYAITKDAVPVPKWSLSAHELDFPIFAKPDVGYGSRGVTKLRNKQELDTHLGSVTQAFVYCEFLPGAEYTVDCFTDYKGNLLFAKARVRNRISNGISVNTIFAHEDIQSIVVKYAKRLNQKLDFQGGWFFQVKEDKEGQLKLLEIAARFGGSSSICRARGVNFPLLSLFDAFGYDVQIEENDYKVELDRALNTKYKIELQYDVVYVDLDDCIIIDGKINVNLMGFLFQARNENKKIILITRHENNLNDTLEKFKIKQIFDEVHHITDGSPKYSVMKDNNSIFIDDSYQERVAVKNKMTIHTFSPDMIECLFNCE